MSKFEHRGSPLISIGQELPNSQGGQVSRDVERLKIDTQTEPLQPVTGGRLEQGNDKFDSFYKQKTEALTEELKIPEVKDTVVFSESDLAEARNKINNLYRGERATEPLHTPQATVEARGTERLPIGGGKEKDSQGGGVWGWLKSKFTRKQKVAETPVPTSTTPSSPTTWLDSAKRLGMTTLDLNNDTKQPYAVHHEDPQAGWRTAAKKMGLNMLDLRPHESVVLPKEHRSLNDTEEIWVAPTKEFTSAELDQLNARTEELNFTPSSPSNERTEPLLNTELHAGNTEALTELLTVKQTEAGQVGKEQTEPLEASVRLNIDTLERMTRPFIETNTEPLPYGRGMETTIIAPTPKSDKQLAHEAGIAAMHAREQKRIAAGDTQYRSELGDNLFRPDLWSGQNKEERFKTIVKHLYEQGVLGEGKGEYQFSMDMPLVERKKYEMLIAQARAELAAPETNPLFGSKPRTVRAHRGRRYSTVGSQRPIRVSARDARGIATAYAAGGVAATARAVRAEKIRKR